MAKPHYYERTFDAYRSHDRATTSTYTTTKCLCNDWRRGGSGPTVATGTFWPISTLAPQ
jgi:hypothetical protein